MLQISRKPFFSRFSRSELVSRRAPLHRAMLALLVLAMLPLAVLALLQAMSRIERDNADARRTLQENLRLAILVEHNVIDGAAGILAMLAEHPDIPGRKRASCVSRLAQMLGYFPAYSNFSLIGPNGEIVCEARGGTTASHTSALDPHWWAQVRSARQALVTAPLWPNADDRARIWVVRPLFEADGEFAGALTASIDSGRLQRQLSQRYANEHARVIVLDEGGRPMLRSEAQLWPHLKVDGPGGEVHDVSATTGENWSYMVSPLGGGPAQQPLFHIAYMVPHHALAGPDWWFLGGHLALPILALLFASGAILLGTQWGILRWIEALRHLSAEYARGNYRARDDIFANAPQEIRDLAASLYRMAHTIEHRDRVLRDSMDRQKALTRELHHRVKNNLQIVISLLTLQGRRLPEASRVALADARLRVGALALVHRLLYETGELTTISTRRLLGELCGLTEQHHEVSDARVDCEIADVSIDIDRAVPLTLWTVEVLSDALMRASGRGAPVMIGVELTYTDGRIAIEVTDDAGTPEGDEPPNALHRLLMAIGRQLGGQVRRENNGGATLVGLNFPLQRIAQLIEHSPRDEVTTSHN